MTYAKRSATWRYEKEHRYHKWTFEAKRTFGWREVWATAVVDSYGTDADSPANWEVRRDGTTVARGHGTVKEAKVAAHRAMWKLAQERMGMRGGRERGQRDVCVGSDCWPSGKLHDVKRPLGKRKAGR